MSHGSPNIKKSINIAANNVTSELCCAVTETKAGEFDMESDARKQIKKNKKKNAFCSDKVA